jgi:precorrin-6B methylase 2
MFLIFIFLAAVLLSVAAASFSLIVWVPTRKKDLSRILALARLQPGENFIDLGCGTGTVSHFLAAETQADIYGIELALPFYFWCRLRQAFSARHSLKYLWGSLFSLDLEKFEVIYVFGIPDRLKDKLRPKLERELKPGARVISYVFAIDGWIPSRIDRPDPQSVPIYLYTR